jgi:hypothetical protein
MAHFARLDENNIVTEVIVVNNDDFIDGNGNENEELGQQVCRNLRRDPDSRWVQTSYNNKIRCRYAGIGYIYDKEYDVFLTPKPFSSWVLDIETYFWEPPIPQPELTEEQIESGNYYEWNEENVEWELKNSN